MNLATEEEPAPLAAVEEEPAPLAAVEEEPALLAAEEPALLAAEEPARMGAMAVAVGRPAQSQEPGRQNPGSPLKSPPTSSNFHSSGSNVTQARSLEPVKMRISPWRAYLQPIAAIAAVGLDWPPSRQSSR